MFFIASVIQAAIGAAAKGLAKAASSGMDAAAEVSGRTVGAAMVLKNETMPGGIFRQGFHASQGQQAAITGSASAAAASAASKIPQG